MFARSRLRLFVAEALGVTVLVWAWPTTTLASWTDLESVREAELSHAANRRVEAMARIAAAYLTTDSDPEASMEHHQRALDLDRSNAPLALDMAGLHLQRAEIPEALAVLKDSLKHNPKSADLALRISGIYLVKLRKMELAERYARKALKVAPDLIEPYQMLYAIARAGGRGEAAAAVLTLAEERRNDNAEFWTGLGDLSVSQMLMEGNLVAQERAGRAVSHFRRAVELGQQDANVLLRALNFFFASGYPDDAVASARRLLVLQPSDTSSREKLAIVLAQTGRLEQAVIELNAVVAENPASLIAYRTHGELLRQQEDFSAALEKFEKALLLSDNDPRLYLEVVDLCLKADKPDRGAWWLAQAREKFNRLPELPFYESQLLGYLLRWEEALHAMDLAADLAAQYQPSFLTAEFYFHYGVMAERAGQHAKAVGHFLSCLEVDGDHAASLNYLAYMWAEQGENLVVAEDYVRRALEQEPQNPAYLDSLGWVLYQQGRYEEALSSLEEAVGHSLQPDPTIVEHLGDVLVKLGRPEEAVTSWQRVLGVEGVSAEVAVKIRAVRATQTP